MSRITIQYEGKQNNKTDTEKKITMPKRSQRPGENTGK